ncbi:UNVERIFIED_CONTAM: hypothetical protein K2H54_014022 [Gekko kuhli]
MAGLTLLFRELSNACSMYPFFLSCIKKKKPWGNMVTMKKNSESKTALRNLPRRRRWQQRNQRTVPLPASPRMQMMKVKPVSIYDSTFASKKFEKYTETFCGIPEP